MNKVFVLILTMTMLKSLAQSKNNRHDILTKDEFRELVRYRDNFIPIDIGDTVIIVKYSGQRLLNMQSSARKISFAKSNVDTTELKDELWMTEKQIEKIKQRMDRFATDYPFELRRKLKKKAIVGIVVNESELFQNKVHFNKYWLKTSFISNQQSLDDNGWVMSTTNLFFDPRANKNFEAFLPLNYNLLDMINR